MAIARIAAEAAASRVAVLVWAVVANLLIPDHEAEGVRLWHAETFRESRYASSTLIKSYSAVLLFCCAADYSTCLPVLVFRCLQRCFAHFMRTCTHSHSHMNHFPSTPPSNRLTINRRVLQTFTRWDSAQFLEIAELGYSKEPSFAFFPGYPILIRAVNRTILPETALFGSSSTPFLSGYSIQERLVRQHHSASPACLL